MRIIRTIRKALRSVLHEIRELLWPSNDQEIGIHRGYLDGRDWR